MQEAHFGLIDERVMVSRLFERLTLEIFDALRRCPKPFPRLSEVISGVWGAVALQSGGIYALLDLFFTSSVSSGSPFFALPSFNLTNKGLPGAGCSTVCGKEPR